MRSSYVEIVRFGVAGIAGLVADVAVLYAGLAIGLGPFAGRALSFVCAVWVTFTLNRRFTFQPGAEADIWAEWWRYLAAMMLGGIVNYGVYTAVVLMLPRTPILPFLAVAAGSIGGMGVNFVSAKFFVFRR